MAQSRRSEASVVSSSRSASRYARSWRLSGGATTQPSASSGGSSSPSSATGSSLSAESSSSSSSSSASSPSSPSSPSLDSASSDASSIQLIWRRSAARRSASPSAIARHGQPAPRPTRYLFTRKTFERAGLAGRRRQRAPSSPLWKRVAV
eukprot:scaffold219050_cov28-Tisochrysis_lutea.AAC.2